MEETDLKAKAKIVNDKSWARKIKLDQKNGKGLADNLDSYVSDMIIPSFQTREFKFLVLKLVEGIKYSIHGFEKDGMEL